jgi:hypothetical protein
MRRRIDCHACRHYYVTWDERFPHGCRKMGFKSGRYPGDAVRSAMYGENCRLFEPKPRAAPPNHPPRK